MRSKRSRHVKTVMRWHGDASRISGL